MEAIRINPAKLDQMHEGLVYEAIKHYKHVIEVAFNSMKGENGAGLTSLLKAVDAFGTGFEVTEYLCERLGAEVIPPIPPSDWYDSGNVLVPLDTEWTDYQIRAFELRYGPEPDPEDTALD
jgi:hypothetical protein